MDIKKPLLITACSLGASLTALGAPQAKSDNNNANTSPKVMIRIPDKDIKSGKILIKDGQVYVRIGTERTMDSGAGKAVDLDKRTMGGWNSYVNID